MTATRTPLRYLAILLLVAVVVRLPTLTWSSLDGDEGASLYYSSLSYRELFVHLADLTIDRHPLLYYVLLKPWRQIAGDADAMLRLPSALAGVLTVGLMYLFGRRRVGEVTAGFAALIFALNPLVIARHQEARMYAPSLLLCVLAVWALWDALDKRGLRAALSLAVFSVALALAVYNHFIAATWFPALGAALICESRRDRRTAGVAMAALAASVAMTLPYLLNILRTGNSGSGMATLSQWLTAMLHAAGTLLAFQTPLVSPVERAVLLALLGLIVALGVWRARHEGTIFALWFVVVFTLTVFVALRIDFYQPKTFVFSTVPLSFLIALACLGKSDALNWRGAVLSLGMLGLTCFALSYLWRPGTQHEDFRNAARFVESRVTRSDTVALHLTWYRYVFGHYYSGPFVHPFANNVDASTPVALGLQPYLGSEVLWLVQAGVGLPRVGGDPDRVVQRWLAERYPVITEVFPNGVDIRGYATRYRFTTLPESATPLDIVYPNGLALVGYRTPQLDLPSHDLWLHPPSVWVPVTLYWSPARPLPGDVLISVRLEDERGNAWGVELPRQDDLRAFYPPLQWQDGEIVRWDLDINVNAQVLPGEYKVVVRVFEAGSAEPLTHSGGTNWLILQRVRLR